MTSSPAHAPSTMLSVRGASKSFGGTHALRDVDLDMRRGEVHALVGGNGSGKSTLIKILAGVYAADAGDIVVGGAPSSLADHTPERARAAGLRFVHQDFGIFPALTVAENLAVGHGFEMARGYRIDWRRNRERATEVLRRFEVDVDPRQLGSSLSVPQRAMVAIARALQDLDEGGVLVLDEPTAALPPHEVDVLATSIRRLSASGRSVLLVTHRLGEVRQLADRVTALRDGRPAGTIESGELTERGLVELIVGRHMAGASIAARDVPTAAPLLEVRGACSGPLRDIDLDVRPGEIVGVAGILGSGRTELLQMIFGAAPLTSGSVSFGGSTVTPTPRRMRDLGVAFVPEDRQAEAVFAGRSVQENMTDGRLGAYFRGLWLRDTTLRSEVGRDIGRFRVKAGSTRIPIDTLSGGNQQKVVLARCLREGPRLLLLDEPTQGIDVGAREEIFQLVTAAADEGCGVIVVSSELEELVRLSDRVVVISQGRITAEHAAPVTAAQLLSSALTVGVITS